jgi:hypothetical protein
LQAPWDEPFVKEWLTLLPGFADTDLSGALYVSCEHAPSTEAIRNSACCERSAGRTFGWLFVRPAPATTTPCKPMSAGFLRIRITIAS